MPRFPAPGCGYRFRWPFACIPMRMRPLTQSALKVNWIGRRKKRDWTACAALGTLTVLSAGASLAGCGGGSTGAETNPPPPSPSIVVTVTPTTASALLGNSQAFSANVANTANTSVTWSVNGVPGGNISTGTISSAGLYTAPADLPSTTTVQVTATSQADATKSATAQLTIASDLTISVAPPNSSVELGSTQGFHAALTSAGHPDTSVRWSLSGPACPAACGAVDLNGNYTAPVILPSPANATLTAQSVADPSKQASAPILITSNFTLQVTAPQSVPAGGTASVVATITPVPGSNPS